MNWSSLLPSTLNPAEAVEALGSEGTFLQGLADLFILSTWALAFFILAWAVVVAVSAFWRTQRYLAPLPDPGKGTFVEVRRDWMASSGPLAGAFNEMLVEVPFRDAPMERELRRCGSAEEVFNDSTLAHRMVGNRLFMATPGILTGIGVLGTFVGLALGIGGLELQGAAIEDLNSSILPLIQGSATAFSTSVWGVATSLVFAILEKLLEGGVRRPIRRLQDRLNRLVPRYLPEQSMIELQRSSAETEGQIKGLAVAIGEQMQEALARVGTSVTDAVREALGGQAMDLGEQSAKLITDVLSEELKDLKSALGEMGEGFKQEFGGANSELQATVAGFETIVSGLKGSVETTQGTVDAAVERLQGHEDVVESIRLAAEHFGGAAEKLVQMRETFELSAQRNAEAAAAQVKAADKLAPIPDTITALAGNLDSAGGSIKGGADAAKEAYETLVEHQRLWFEGVETGLRLMRDRLQQLIDAYGQQVEGQTQEHMNRWTGAVEESLGKFSIQVEALDGAISELTEAMGRD